MEEVAHDAVARCPIVAVAGVVVGAEAGGAERGLTALGAETHDRKPRRPTDSSIAVLPGFGLGLSLGGDPTGQSCSFHTRRGAVGPLGGIDPLKRTTRAEEREGILIVAATLSAQGVLDPVSAALIRLGLQCLVSSDYCQAPGGVRWQLP